MIYFPHNFLRIHFIVIYPSIMVANLIGCITNHINKIFDLFSSLSTIHNPYGHHFIQTVNINLQICKTNIIPSTVHFLYVGMAFVMTAAVEINTRQFIENRTNRKEILATTITVTPTQTRQIVENRTEEGKILVQRVKLLSIMESQSTYRNFLRMRAVTAKGGKITFRKELLGEAIHGRRRTN